jgi:hypothetical protein
LWCAEAGTLRAPAGLVVAMAMVGVRSVHLEYFGSLRLTAAQTLGRMTAASQLMRGGQTQDATTNSDTVHDSRIGADC